MRNEWRCFGLRKGNGKGEEEVKYAGGDRGVCANSGAGMRHWR